MCLPALAAVPALLSSVAGAAGAAQVGLGVASSVLGFVGQQQQAKNQTIAANLNFAQKYNQVSAQNAQLNAQQSEQNLGDAIKAAQSFGAIAASASSIGVGSSTLSSVLNSDAVASGRQTAVSDANFAAKRQALGTDLHGAELQRVSDQGHSPSFASLALGIGGAAFSGATTYAKLGGKF